MLLERFISADCATCWSAPATPAAGAREIALDWVVPGARGDDAPLSAVATRDSLERMESLRLQPSGSQWERKSRVTGQSGALRVAHGLPFNGYVGTSIELKPVPRLARGSQWTGWLALVETLPAGAEGSPVERNLVRNLFKAQWKTSGANTAKAAARWFDSRSMSLAEGANPERLRLVGWVEDAHGRVVNAAVSRCVPP